MSEHLKDPTAFDEGPLYITVDKENHRLLDYRNIRDKDDYKGFVKRALTNDIESMPGREIRFIRVDSSGVFEVFPEVKT